MPGPKRDGAVSALQKIARQSPDELQPNTVKLLFSLWNDPDFRATRQRRHAGLQLQDCYDVFMNKLIDKFPSWGGPNWTPSIDDCVRARSRTSMVEKETILLNDITMNIYDAGGQRAERKKWMSNFAETSIDVVIFVAALSEYDQTCFEERSKNRLVESLDLFHEALSLPSLKNSKCILFLNKKDIFERKFSQDKIHLNVSGKFPQYSPKDPSDSNEAIDFVTALFRKRRDTFLKQHHVKKTADEMYIHITSATEEVQTDVIFQTMSKLIVPKLLVTTTIE